MKRLLFVLIMFCNIMFVNAQNGHWISSLKYGGTNLIYSIDKDGDFVHVSVVYNIQDGDFSIIYSISALGVWSKNSKTVNITYKEEPMIILSDYSFGEDKKELEKALKSDKEKEKMWFDSLIESHKANMQENINMFKSFEITKKSGKTMEIFVGGGYLTFTKM